MNSRWIRTLAAERSPPHRSPRRHGDHPLHPAPSSTSPPSLFCPRTNSYLPCMKRLTLVRPFLPTREGRGPAPAGPVAASAWGQAVRTRAPSAQLLRVGRAGPAGRRWGRRSRLSAAIAPSHREQAKSGSRATSARTPARGVLRPLRCSKWGSAFGRRWLLVEDGTARSLRWRCARPAVAAVGGEEVAEDVFACIALACNDGCCSGHKPTGANSRFSTLPLAHPLALLLPPLRPAHSTGDPPPPPPLGSQTPPPPSSPYPDIRPPTSPIAHRRSTRSWSHSASRRYRSDRQPPPSEHPASAVLSRRPSRCPRRAGCRFGSRRAAAASGRRSLWRGAGRAGTSRAWRSRL